jgi:hypothetical protein
MNLRMISLLVLTTVACFDPALPQTLLPPFIGCSRNAECPTELPICAERLGTCVVANTVCLEPDGKNAVDGNECGSARVCIAGVCTDARCGDGIESFDEECDDANDVDIDACISCKDAACGDGIVQEGVEDCDSTAGCRANCELLDCIEGAGQCNGDVIVYCEKDVFRVERDCGALQATCVQDSRTYCETTAGQPCFNGATFSTCAGGVCNVDTATTGECTSSSCEGGAGRCVAGKYQAYCNGNASLSVDCDAFGATCQNGVGCVLAATESCTPFFTTCVSADGRTEPCPEDGRCLMPFIDLDGDTRDTARTVTVPSTSTSNLTPARDEDCVAFTLDEAQFLKLSTTMSVANCSANQADPTLVVINDEGQIVVGSEDTNLTNACAMTVAAFEPGSYRTCAYESHRTTRGTLFDVSVHVEAVEVQTVTLPYADTIPVLTPEPTCFAFTLTEPRPVTVNVGLGDPRCMNVLDTVASLEGEFVDDIDDDLCGVLTTQNPLPAGTHVACAASYDARYSNIAIRIEIEQ